MSWAFYIHFLIKFNIHFLIRLKTNFKFEGPGQNLFQALGTNWKLNTKTKYITFEILRTSENENQFKSQVLDYKLCKLGDQLKIKSKSQRLKIYYTLHFLLRNAVCVKICYTSIFTSKHRVMCVYKGRIEGLISYTFSKLTKKFLSFMRWV